MARTGRPRTPTALHVLRGNPGHRRLSPDEPKPDAYTGACPAWLDRHGREFWRAYAPPLARLGLLTELDVPSFAAACERWSLYRRASAKLKRTFTHQTGPNGLVAKPESAIAKAALDGARAILSEFGFSPAARAKLGSRPPGEIDPLEVFRREKRTRG